MLGGLAQQFFFLFYFQDTKEDPNKEVEKTIIN